MTESLARRVDAYCDRVGLEPDDPLRLMHVATAANSDEAKKAAAEARDAAKAVAAEARAEVGKAVRGSLPHLAVPAGRLQSAVVAAVFALGVALGAAGGWWGRGHASVDGQKQAALEALRWNDLGRAIENGRPQPPQNGRAWRWIPWWDAPPAQPGPGR